MILNINTSDQELVKLSAGDKHHQFSTHNLSETLVVEIKKFLKKNKISFQSISEVKLINSPRHFSRVRTGVAVTNALVFGLNLSQKMIKPVYDKQPNITLPRGSKKY